jgi:hypothetical protein
MLLCRLIVPIGVNDGLLNSERVIEIVQYLAHFEGCWDLVTLWSYSAIILQCDELWQTLTVWDKVAADVCALVG